MKNPLTLAGIEPATIRFVTQHHTRVLTVKIQENTKNLEKIICNLQSRFYTSNDVHSLTMFHKEWKYFLVMAI